MQMQNVESPRRIARTARAAAAGWGAIGAMEPLTRNPNARPALIPLQSRGISPGATMETSCP